MTPTDQARIEAIARRLFVVSFGYPAKAFDNEAYVRDREQAIRETKRILRADKLPAEHAQLKADVLVVLRDARRYVSADADEYETTPPVLVKLDALLDRLKGGVT